MSKQSGDALTESMFYTLMALRQGEKCGTEIADFAVKKTGGAVRIGPGTLYMILATFLENGLIGETAVEGRKRTYALTARGEARYTAELLRLRRCLADAGEEREV